MAKNTTPLEKEENKLFAKWLDTTGMLFSHIANESRSGAQAKYNQMIGVRGGVPDFLVITPKGLVFVEMKRQKGGVTSDNQKEWITALNKIPSIQAQVCNGFQEAKAFVTHFL